MSAPTEDRECDFCGAESPTLITLDHHGECICSTCTGGRWRKLVRKAASLATQARDRRVCS